MFLQLKLSRRTDTEQRSMKRTILTFRGLRFPMCTVGEFNWRFEFRLEASTSDRLT